MIMAARATLHSSLLLLILSTTIIVEVSTTPLLRLSDLIAGRKCNQIVCPTDLQVFNKTSCHCECLKTECLGYQVLNQQTCNCECPKEKVASICRHDNQLYDDSKCDCVAKTRKSRQNQVGSAPPPPPPPPPPPSTICPITARNCTNNLKVFNQTACECQCIQFKPANVTTECPTPEPRTPTPRGNRNNKPEPFDTNKYDFVYGDDGCPELTPKGKKYRKVRISRRGKRKTKGRKKKGEKTPTKKSKSKSKSTSNEEEPTTEAPAAIRAPMDSCPVGQVANPDTCQCMEI